MNSNSVIAAIVGVVVAVIGIVIISQVLNESLITQDWVNSFTGLSQIARLLPLAIVGSVIAGAVYMFKMHGKK